MSVEIIIQFEDIIDRLQHTRECESDQYYNKGCTCGINKIRESFDKYKGNVWRENRTG